jgi:hypothetical protein
VKVARIGPGDDFQVYPHDELGDIHRRQPVQSGRRLDVVAVKKVRHH